MLSDSQDFTEENYSYLLRLAAERYRFVQYHDFLSAEVPAVVWRHDVDFSVHRSLSLAKIEKESGISSTFFFQLGSAFYNVFEPSVTERIKRILELEHHVGLHFDPTIYSISERRDLERFLLYEREILEGLLGIKIEVFSFHNPTPEILENDDYTIAGMINTYAREFREHAGYCSDSNGYWRHERLEDVLKSGIHHKLQVLTHPAWWQREVMPPRQRIQRCIEGRKRATERFYDEMLAHYGRENVGK